MRASGVYEINRHYQNANHLRQDQKYREKFFPKAVSGKGSQFFYGDRLAAERKIHMDGEFPEMSLKLPF